MSKCNDKHCKYNDEGCIFFAQGSGNPEDMPCAEAEFPNLREELHNAVEEVSKAIGEV